MEKDVSMSAEYLRDILEDIQGGILLCSYDWNAKIAEVTYANRGWTDITGYTMETFHRETGGNPQSLVLPEDRESVKAEFMRQITRGGPYELLFRIVHRSGALRWVIAKGTLKPMLNGRVQIHSIVTDVTVIKEREEHMALLAQTDQLTGLTNKATFALLAQSILIRRGANQHALLMLDIDGFKSVNDTYGHAVGDKVLEAVAARLKTAFRSSDIVGRVGGDEFMVLMTDISGVEAVAKKARALCGEIRSICIPGRNPIPITMSVGVSFYMGEKSFEPLFAEADAALYRAKGNGKDQCVFANAPPTDKEVSKNDRL